MRLLTVSLAGGGTAVAGFVLSGLTGGPIHGVLLMAAMLCTALTVGVMGAELIDFLDRGPIRASRHDRDHSSRVRLNRTFRSQARCDLCRQMRQRLGAVWVCHYCDTMANEQT
jgi:hypothetical protein